MATTVRDAVAWWVECHEDLAEEAHYLATALPVPCIVETNRREPADRYSLVLHMETLVRRYNWQTDVKVSCTHRVSAREIRMGQLKDFAAYIVRCMAFQLAEYIVTGGQKAEIQRQDATPAPISPNPTTGPGK